MRQCVECRGLVPGDVEACPNCNVGRRPGAMKMVLVAVGFTVSSCLSAALPYGIAPCPDGTHDCYDPCNQALADGGSPRNDPSTGCAPLDGGTADGGTDGGMP